MVANAGGFVILTIDGTRYSPVGEVEVEPTNFEVEVNVNSDGSLSRSVKPKARKLMVTLRDRKGLDIETIMSASSVDISFFERHMNRIGFMTAATATGTVKRNTQNGEISGIEFQSENLRFVQK